MSGTWLAQGEHPRSWGREDRTPPLPLRAFRECDFNGSLIKSEAVSILHTLLQRVLSPHTPLHSGESRGCVVYSLAPGHWQADLGSGACLPDLSRLASHSPCRAGSGVGMQDGCLWMNLYGAEKQWESVHLQGYFRSDDLIHPAEAQ